jgi:D-threo-aldose 1-dehydrogenase
MLLPLCEERGIAVIAGGVFNSGVLAGGTTFNYAPASTAVLGRVRTLRETCARWDVPLPAAAVQFPGRNPVVASVLVGCRTPAEVDEDVALSVQVLPGGLWAELA